METLVVSHHRNQHQDYSRNRGHTPGRFGSFGSPPSGNFRAINCRTFHSESGLLCTPSKSCSSPPLSNMIFSSSFSPQTPTSSVNDSQKHFKGRAKSSSIPIPNKIEFENDTSFIDQLHFSERWAGPAYSNSPPPSSLPMPKFSLRPKRTISLDLPSSVTNIDFHPIAKSAPASPTGVRSPSPSDLFDNSDYASTTNLFDSSDHATKTLRRILNLDVSDE